MKPVCTVRGNSRESSSLVRGFKQISGWLSGAWHARADTFHKPGFKMHAKILHHLFTNVNTDVIKAPLWDTAALGPAAFPNNAAFVHQHVSQLLATSFPNLRPQQVEVRRLLLKPSSVSQRMQILRIVQSPACSLRTGLMVAQDWSL